MIPIPSEGGRVSGLRSLFIALGALAAGSLFSTSAFAVDFRLCNATKSRVGVAVGYKDGDNWITEGWWNVGAASCETLLKGALVSRFYYVYAIDYDHGGEWGGTAFMCTREKEFTIRGIDNCLARNFSRTGFFEIDTGEERSWTVQLTDKDIAAPPADAATRQAPQAADGRSSTPGAPTPPE